MFFGEAVFQGGLVVNLERLNDMVNRAHNEIGKYKFTVTLSPKKMIWNKYDFESLDWESICYGEAEITKVPDDKRGVYAFAVCTGSNVLPPHSYILYIGIAGRNSNRSLRERYKDYLTESKVRKREGIARMIVDWYEVLRFFFAPVDDTVSSADLQKLEKQLNTALMPPFSKGDLDADTKRKQRAFP